jgi:hypothetical protein
MCFGGGQAATITMPDTRAYDRMADMQISAMRQQQDGEAKLKQIELERALRSQEVALTELRDFNVQRANDTAANAARLAALIGTPPPEKSAKAPVVGSSRSEVAKPKGRSALRIDRPAPTSQAAGAGLNIVTAS